MARGGDQPFDEVVLGGGAFLPAGEPVPAELAACGHVDDVERPSLPGPEVGQRVDDDDVVVLPLFGDHRPEFAWVERGKPFDHVERVRVGVQLAAAPFGVDEEDPPVGGELGGDLQRRPRLPRTGGAVDGETKLLPFADSLLGSD